jgi:signal transduction histidine kinase
VPHDGRIVLRVRPTVDYSDSSRPGVRIVIADNGNGIPADTREKIFEPFFTTKGERGTGLGLWVTSGIVSKHEGRIRFRSRDDAACSGTVFSIFLPFERRVSSRPSAAA